LLRHCKCEFEKKPKVGRKEKTWSKQRDEWWRSRCWVTRVSKHHFRDVNGASIMPILCILPWC